MKFTTTLILIFFFLQGANATTNVPNFELNCSAQISDFSFRVVVMDRMGIVFVINKDGTVFNTISGLTAKADDPENSHPGYFIYLTNQNKQEVAALFINTRENLINGSISDFQLDIFAGVNCTNTQPIFID